MATLAHPPGSGSQGEPAEPGVTANTISREIVATKSEMVRDVVRRLYQRVRVNRGRAAQLSRAGRRSGICGGSTSTRMPLVRTGSSSI